MTGGVWVRRWACTGSSTPSASVAALPLSLFRGFILPLYSQEFKPARAPSGKR